jgi:hypothetical protein
LAKKKIVSFLIGPPLVLMVRRCTRLHIEEVAVLQLVIPQKFIIFWSSSKYACPDGSEPAIEYFWPLPQNVLPPPGAFSGIYVTPGAGVTNVTVVAFANLDRSARQNRPGCIRNATGTGNGGVLRLRIQPQ